MNVTVTDHLSEEDRRLWLGIVARRDAVETNPRVYTKEQTEEIMVEWWQFMAHVAKTYEIDEEESWRISPADGTINYGN